MGIRSRMRVVFLVLSRIMDRIKVVITTASTAMRTRKAKAARLTTTILCWSVRVEVVRSTLTNKKRNRKRKTETETTTLT